MPSRPSFRTFQLCAITQNLVWHQKPPEGSQQRELALATPARHLMLLPGATDGAAPTTQHKKERRLTNNEARREGQRGHQRTLTDKLGRIPYTLPQILRSSV